MFVSAYRSANMLYWLQVPASQALAVLLQHPVASDQQIVCKLLQVCKAWRSVVQQSAACLTNIDATVDSEKLHLLADLGSWVATYPGLIHGIRIMPASREGWQAEVPLVTARRVLECSLQLAAAGGSAPLLTTSSSGPSAAATSQPLWRLASYQNDLVATPVMLAAVPAATMTKLNLKNLVTSDAAALASHLQRLSSLKDLSLISKSALPPDVSIRHLTAVDHWNGEAEPLHSQSFGLTSTRTAARTTAKTWCQTQCQFCGGRGGGGTPGVDGVNLREVTLHADRDWPDGGVVFPRQLQRLIAGNGSGNDKLSNRLGITELQHLEYLRIGGNMLLPNQYTMLQSLNHMPRLHELHLVDSMCFKVEHARAFAGVFPTLTMLRSLEMMIWYYQAEKVCQTVGLATSITRLALHFTSFQSEAQDGDDETDILRFWNSLKGLMKLRDLTVVVTKDSDVKSSEPLGGFFYFFERGLLHVDTSLPQAVLSTNWIKLR